jgi:hypothetical protein
MKTPFILVRMKFYLFQRKTIYLVSMLVMNCLLAIGPLSAHEIPERVQLKILIHEDGNNLDLLVRVPLEAMRDVDFSLRGPGYLNFSESLPMIQEAINLWVLDEIKLYQGKARLHPATREIIRISLPSDNSFASYATAIQQFSRPLLPDDTTLFWRQAYINVRVNYLLKQPETSFNLEPSLSGLGQKTSSAVTFIDRNETKYQYDYVGDPGLLTLNPDPLQVINRFIYRGFLHILSGIDHLLFLAVLLVPVRSKRSLIMVVTAFTLGHSITLASAVLGFLPASLWFPDAIELLIAVSILILAIDNLVTKEHHSRWIIGLVFGLVHGFGFSFGLSQSLQYSGSHLWTGLLGFNLGVELGQLFVICLALPLIIFIRQLKQERLILIIVSLVIAHTGLHWTLDRWQFLSAYF